jgi:asparagine synthase (glutamine-hydrolysing)
MFAEVHKLPAAHVLQLSGGQVTTRRYWDLNYEPKRSLTEAQALGQVDEALRETVRLHLVSDVPVGAFLSGGIDSGLVAALAQELSEAPLQTFSVGVPFGDFNEAPAARAVAERYGTVHHEGEVGGDLAGLLPTLVAQMDEPSDPLSACMYWLARMTRNHVKVVVGGDGGDELFGGYDRYYGTQYVRYYAALPRFVRRQVVRRVLDLAPDGFWYKSLTHRLKWMDELAEVDGGRRYARGLSYFYFPPNRTADLYTDAFRAATKDFDAEESLIAWQDTEHAKTAVDKMLLADSMVRLPNHPVMILDRMTMAHGLEARSPFLDHVFAGLCATLAPRLKIRGRQRRYIQMRLAERYLPEEVLRRPKQGFSSGLPYLMGKQFRALFTKYLPHARLVEEGFLQGAPIAKLLSAHLEGRKDHGNRLWLLLNAELWYRVFIDQVALPDLEEEVNGALALTAPSSRAVVVPS